ncbi:MAG TPA: HAMP domain-containing sensor histidine kinase, partial [Cyclobacteriaceae bacterium]
MLELWNRVSNIGVYSELPFSDRSRIRISNQVSVIASILTLLYFVVDLLVVKQRTHEQLLWFYLFHIISLLIYGSLLLFNTIGWYITGRYVFIISMTVIITINSFIHGEPFRAELYLFSGVAFVFVVFKDWKIILPVFLFMAGCYLVLVINIMHHHPDIAQFNVGLIMRVIISFIILYTILYFLRRETNQYQEMIEENNSQLSEDRNEMEKLNFTKDKIFSIISHDLRSPIGSLKAVLSLLKDEHIGIDEFKKATAGLEKQVHQLSASLDELLTWSKAQLHGINPNPEVFKLKPVVGEVITVNKIAARNKTIIITTNIPSDITVYCDSNMLKSVITNLTTNAIKFTPVGGAISIVGKKENDRVIICVEDTGVGIPQENMEKIMSASTHFSTRGTNNEKGTGLGLVMCNEFV